MPYSIVQCLHETLEWARRNQIEQPFEESEDKLTIRHSEQDWVEISTVDGALSIRYFWNTELHHQKEIKYVSLDVVKILAKVHWAAISFR